jgi:protocatechuate 3,4-dioxygenase alpha subunit
MVAFIEPAGTARLRETPSQTAGPYVHIGLIPSQAGLDIFGQDLGRVLAGPDAAGERILIEGRIFDGAGALCNDVLVEVWQANAFGRYDHPADEQDRPLDPAFHGWGRTGTDFRTGVWSFETVKPGAVSGRHGRPMAPHLSLWLASRGMNIGLATRMYFPDEAEANAADPVLGIVGHPRRDTLVARREERNGGPAPGLPTYVFDIHLQGDRETVFFDI